MKKYILAVALLCMLLFVACNKDNENTVVKMSDLKAQVATVLEKASYENLDIHFENVDGMAGDELSIINIYFESPTKGLSYEEAMNVYVEDILPRMLDMETIDTNYVFDMDSRLPEEGEHRIRTYKKNYEDILATLDEYETVPRLVYANNDTWTELYYMDDWRTAAYITQGKLGSIAPSMSAFSAYGVLEEVKEYDCRLDDLSDSYMLMDGEKTIAEAVKEIEAYYDAHYPVNGVDNGIRNKVFGIVVCKIPGTEYYGFKAYRTLSYNGIAFREMPANRNFPDEETVFLGESALIESNKVDVTIGLINSYAKPEVARVITKVVPFQEVMDRVAYYLTGETRFQLLHAAIEYRMYVTEEGSRLVPYWCFIAQNPNDESMIKIYMDMETGETESMAY